MTPEHSTDSLSSTIQAQSTTKKQLDSAPPKHISPIMDEVVELLMYRNGVEDLANLKSEQIHYNSGPEHAMIVFKNIFNSARKEINIFSGSFDDRVCNNDSNDYLKSLESYLYGGGKLNIILNSYVDSSSNPTINLLKRFMESDRFKNNIVIKKTNKKLYYNKVNEMHFTTADDRIYRKEIDIEKFIATFSFNQPNEVTKLNEQFHNIFSDPNLSQTIELLPSPYLA